MGIRQLAVSLMISTAVSAPLLAEEDLPEPITYLLEKAATQAAIPGGIKSLIYPSMTKPLDQGELGGIRKIKVLQVISETECLADVSWDEAVRYTSGGDRYYYRVEEVTEKGVWIDGLPTSGLADDHSYELSEPAIFEVKGTKSFTTAIGAKRTVLRLVFFNVSKYERLFLVEAAKRLPPDEDAAKAETPKEPAFREWSDESGRFTVRAKFVSKKRDFVTLEKEDGSQIKVLIRRLRREDRDWLATLKDK